MLYLDYYHSGEREKEGESERMNTLTSLSTTTFSRRGRDHHVSEAWQFWLVWNMYKTHTANKTTLKKPYTIKNLWSWVSKHYLSVYFASLLNVKSMNQEKWPCTRLKRSCIILLIGPALLRIKMLTLYIWGPTFHLGCFLKMKQNAICYAYFYERTIYIKDPQRCSGIKS